jgi:hypothetical protein
LKTGTPKRRNKENQADDCEENREFERKYSNTKGSSKESELEGMGTSEEGTPKSGSEPNEIKFAAGTYPSSDVRSSKAGAIVAPVLIPDKVKPRSQKK